MTRLLSSRYRPLLTIAGCYLIVSLLLRLVLWWRFGTASEVGTAEVPGILARGLLNDAVELLYLLAPFSLYLWLMPRRWYAARWQRGVLALGAYVTLFGMGYLAAAEFFFFEEFDARFNLVAVDYLIYPHEVFVNIWESYPVGAFLIANALASAALLLVLWHWLMPPRDRDVALRPRSAFAGSHAALLALAIAGFSTHALATGDNRVADELAANGVSSFFLAARTHELDYQQHYRVAAPDRMTDLLRAELAQGDGEFTGADAFGLQRHHAARPDGLGPLNVVVIVEESFGARFVGAYGAPTSTASPSRDCCSRTPTPPARAPCAAWRPSPPRSRRSPASPSSSARATSTSPTGAR